MNSCRNSRLCCGISISTSKSCKNYAQIGDFCFLHKDQIIGKTKFEVPITQTENDSNKNQSQNNYCNGITSAGTRCNIRLKSSNFCYHHRTQNSEKFDEKSPSDNLNVTPTQQCNGFTKSGNKCKNKFKHDGKFCHVHSIDEDPKNNLFVPGRAKQKYYSIDVWIKSDISKETRMLLKNEMEKPISGSDESGFIYVYCLEDNNDNAQYSLYKVGRSINVGRRLYEWHRQCKYRPKLIKAFPMNLSSLNNEDIESTRENISCKYTHRVERLIHIELKSKFNTDIEKCNCGIIHQEWFKVTNLDSNSIINGMHGWDEIHKIIVHWVSYIEEVYGQTQ